MRGRKGVKSFLGGEGGGGARIPGWRAGGCSGLPVAGRWAGLKGGMVGIVAGWLLVLGTVKEKGKAWDPRTKSEELLNLLCLLGCFCFVGK